MVLDDTVKRKINNARDILVGKVPDPKAQIEQITIALIYKFMDDMDKKLGERIYFKNELKDYSWDAVLNEKDSATFFEKYVAAIDLFQRAEHFPKFFQEVFKNAYVPYKDSRTLKLFLTEMSYFDYDHSEKLGDAFEYLLSVMGSQGDAGQFRTPRHIIDFIVDIFEPQIGEKILDPACGTAGFLISAVKNIEKREGTLGRIEINRIRDNLFGFYISPDMVRLALVNMFLHGFSDPQIEEFDTLSSDKKWNDRYDLILANPPFMSPKGGIQPHDLLLTAIDSKRAEVLFTSYILTHLKEKGRAGIIVPEGIIFQSGKAYKKLREELINNGLFAVLSLPSGVFNPYSGVKTSILLIDKNIKSDKILFVKIENDGFDLGSQRRENGKNDLPDVTEIIKEYVKTGELLDNSLSHLVLKSKLGENGEYNLSGDRYKEVEVYSGSYPMVELGEISKVSSGNSAPQGEKYFDNGEYPFFRTSDVGVLHISINLIKSRDLINKLSIEELKLKKFEKGTILFPKSGASTFLNHRVMMGVEGFVSSHLATIKGINDKVLDEYLYYQLLKINAKSLCPDQAYPSLKISQIQNIKIPLAPIEIQKKIVEEIESYQKIIDGAKLVVNNYKPRIDIDPEWDLVELGNKELFNIESGGTPSSTIKEYWNGDLNWITLADLPQKEYITKLSNSKRKITELGLKKSSAKMIPVNSILISSRATIGRIAINEKELSTNQGFKNIVIKNFDKVNISYLAYLLKSFEKTFQNLATGGTFKEISKGTISNVKIPLPSLKIQEQIVKEIESEQNLINSNKELIKIFNKKIENVITKVWKE